MDIEDVRLCADFYQKNFLEMFYIVSTYNNNGFILIGEKENFPHLIGIDRNVYNSNGYRSARTLYNDILAKVPINIRIIPNSISNTSKMYKKIINFQESTKIFWNNKGPLAINYDSSLSSKKLNNVDILLSDLKLGYMLGWKENKNVQVNAEILLKKYCMSSWIDESLGSTFKKEKYIPSQTVELIRNVFAFDKNSNLIKQKEYKYSSNVKKDVLQMIERNCANLLINAMNEKYYIEIVKRDKIHCKINGIQY